MHMCISKLNTIGSDNVLLPGRRQAIIWTYAGILVIRPLGTNYSKVLTEIHTFSFKKMHLKMSAKWRIFCLSLNVLRAVHLLKYCSLWKQQWQHGYDNYKPFVSNHISKLMNKRNWMKTYFNKGGSLIFLLMYIPCFECQPKLYLHQYRWCIGITYGWGKINKFRSFLQHLKGMFTHCGLVTPYGDTDLGQHWLR